MTAFYNRRKPFELLFSKQQWEIRQTDKNSSILLVSSIFLAFISLILTILNIVKAYWFMTWATSILTIGLLVAALFAWKGKRLTASIVLMLLIAALFSMFAITGQNYGFAILWTLLVPIISMNLLSLELGAILSFYFQIFLVVIFYTPLKDVIGNGQFNSTFIMRFPLLYLCSFGGTFILAISKEENYVIKTMQSYLDGLTGLYNRARYIKELDGNVNSNRVSICSFDLNGLKRANDTFGHETGDKLIIGAAGVLKNTWKDGGMVFRLGGDEFMVIVRKASSEVMKDIEQYKINLEASNLGREVPISFSYGVASSELEGTTNLTELAKIADHRMYADKELYYSVREHERRKS